MSKTFSIRFPASSFDNRQSKNQKRPRGRKLVGIFALALTLTIGGVVAQAQQPGKVFRIGYLDPSTESAVADFLDAFRKDLSKLGWIEKKNIAIEYRFAEQNLDRLPELAAELVNQKLDLIVVGTGPTPLAAKKATSTIPIVMRSSVDPVSAGLVASLARPGGNITGFSSLSPELNTKRLEILKDAIPKLSRVGYLLTSGATVSVTGELLLKEIRAGAIALKLKLEEISAEPGIKSLENAFKSAKQKQLGAIMIAPGSRLFKERKWIVELAGKHRMPAIYPNKGYINEGGLMFYGADIADNSRRVAVYVDKILRGTKPADLPVQQATRFEFVINLKAAKQIGLALSPEFLSRANQVIK